MTPTEVLSHFDLTGAKQQPDGSWMIRCPVHKEGKERTPHLRLTFTNDGTTLLKCRVGCSTQDILDARGLQMKDLFPHNGDGKTTSNTKPKVVATYPYHDANGNLLYETVRYQPKDFKQRRPNGQGGWLWNLKGVSTVIYRLPQIKKAVNAGKTIRIPEGEKDVEALVQLVFEATCNPMGAGKWRPEHSEMLRGANEIIVYPDADEPGHRHGEQIARSLYGKVTRIKVVPMPDGFKDVSDWIAAGHTAQELLQLEEAAPQWMPTEVNESSEEKSEEKPTHADILLGLAKQEVELWQTPEGEPFATVTIHKERRILGVKERGSGLRPYLVQKFTNMTGSPPSPTAIQGVMEVLGARAIFDGPVHPLYLRIGEHGGKIYFDTGHKDDFIEITSEGWRVIKETPIRFRHTADMRPVRCPIANGQIEELKSLLNTENEDDWILTVAWMLGALRPGYPFPIMALYGEEGSGKTVRARLLKMIVDPCGENGRGVAIAPRNGRDLAVVARNRHVLAFDNLSILDDWFSDFLCCASTGTGWQARKYYTDTDENTFYFKKPIIINGIETLATRGDLLDRCLVVTLPQISSADRKREDNFWRDAEHVWPSVLGGLLNAACEALRNLPDVVLDDLPRMADFAAWVVAAEPKLPWEKGKFMEAYLRNRNDAVETTLQSSCIAPFIMDLARYGWEGTSSALLARLGAVVDEKTMKRKDWPADAPRLSGALRRIAKPLRKKGIEIDFMRKDEERLISLKLAEKG